MTIDEIEDQQFSDWFSDLNAIAIEKGFAHAGDPEKWRSDYENCRTPADAWNGDWDLY